MPDHKEMGRRPTKREREITFAPHESPNRQADGDPGAKRPRLIHDKDEDKDEQREKGDLAGQRGRWQSEE
ncbi:MAG: hypothetical protein ACT443_10265 [Gemmatimonadota bacterium]